MVGADFRRALSGIELSHVVASARCPMLNPTAGSGSQRGHEPRTQKRRRIRRRGARGRGQGTQPLIISATNERSSTSSLFVAAILDLAKSSIAKLVSTSYEPGVVVRTGTPAQTLASKP